MLFRITKLFIIGRKSLSLMRVICLIPAMVCVTFLAQYTNTISNLNKDIEPNSSIIIANYAQQESQSYLLKTYADKLRDELLPFLFNKSIVFEILVSTVTYETAVSSIGIRGIETFTGPSAVNLIDGRLPEIGGKELIVGERLLTSLGKNFKLGQSKLSIGGWEWTVVGIFNNSHPERDLETLTYMQDIWDVYSLWGNVSSIKLSATDKEFHAIKDYLRNKYEYYKLAREKTLYKNSTKQLTKFVSDLSLIVSSIVITLSVLSILVVFLVGKEVRFKQFKFVQMFTASNAFIYKQQFLEAIVFSVFSAFISLFIYVVEFSGKVLSVSTVYTNLEIIIPELDLALYGFFACLTIITAILIFFISVIDLKLSLRL